MKDAASKSETQHIVVDEVFPVFARDDMENADYSQFDGPWLMIPASFEPVEGKHFTYQTTPARGMAPFIVKCWR
jgi:hypothetical protein